MPLDQSGDRRPDRDPDTDTAVARLFAIPEFREALIALIESFLLAERVKAKAEVLRPSARRTQHIERED